MHLRFASQQPMTSMLVMKTYRRPAQIRYGISPQSENPEAFMVNSAGKSA